jgi:hypothetical protein
MRCPFALSVWREASTLNPDVGSWQGDTYEEALQEWIKTPTPLYLRALSLIAAWGIWIARNNKIFRDASLSSVKVAANTLSILDHLKTTHSLGQGTHRPLCEELIDKGYPWAYFDGAASGDQLHCGGEAAYTYPINIFSTSEPVWDQAQITLLSYKP